MKSYLDCWASVAAALFAQALAGEPELAESPPRPFTAGSFGWTATLAGEAEGRFSVSLDGALLDSSLVGDGMDQKQGWSELIRETADAAAGDLLARTGKHCKLVKFEEISGEDPVTHGFQLRSGERAWTILVRDEVKIAGAVPDAGIGREEGAEAAARPELEDAGSLPAPGGDLSPGLALLLDVELEVALRFGSREMPLGEILDLGPGDVVELDRQVTDPVDLIVGDKIVARGEVVVVNGNFGLRVTEVAAPKKRLESIRCLF
jgi:flagellar motor switch protein FliN